ncbi:unnamed protein product [Dibothriocephalus latus]|uniref:Uncharacterized protein n=1 Tax=Dibothriocephalus latus TaxID=60516 RepID=A0A3P7PEY6_DIBLA|nr:unnamed protein product [Dibothriocephalus latus]
MVGNINDPGVVDPELADDDIMYRQRDLIPSEMVSRTAQDEVADPDRLNLKVLATELSGHGEIEPGVPSITLTMERSDWRVVAHL